MTFNEMKYEILKTDEKIMTRWGIIHEGKLDIEMEEALRDEIISLGTYRSDIMYRIEKGLY